MQLLCSALLFVASYHRSLQRSVLLHFQSMGLMSRTVLPACGSVCVCCPALRTRSRQPVKRYNMLLADIYPRLQDEVPNDRKIGKLVEYAAKNPLRIPKIACGLEQRGLKELKSEHLGTVRTVMRAFSKLLIACRDEMSLFANNALTMIKALLDQPRQDSMRILGCMTLVDFIRVQTDATYMRNLDALVPPLCALTREHGEEKKRMPIRAAALQTLAAMVGFMGQHSHIPSEFDEIVAATLENYDFPTVEVEAIEIEKGEAEQQWIKEVMRSEGHAHALRVIREALRKLHRHKSNDNIMDPLNLTREEADAPSVWSRICIQNMATLAKEATTARRVLDPMFCHFDAGKHWSLERGLALVVLQNMQFLMEQTGNGQLLLAALVRHLDHKNVQANLVMKRNIVALAAVLASQSRAKATVAEVGAMSDLLKHLRKSLQVSLENLVGGSLTDDNVSLQAVIEECLMAFGRRVGDAGPLLDMMASMLEKLSVKPVVARSTIQAVSVLALAVAFLPDQLNTHQEFPEALFNELLQAMLHPDLETRIEAHRIFVLVLVPSSVSQCCPYEQQFLPHVDLPSPGRSKKRVSAFASAAALFERLIRDKSSGDNDEEDGKLKSKTGTAGRAAGKTDSMGEGNCQPDSSGRDEVRCGREDNPNGCASPSRLQAFKLSLGRSMANLRRPSTAGNKETENLNTARLSGRQATLLLSALWLQAKMADNWPSSYEAMAHTYSLAILFSNPRSANHCTQFRALQLALSTRSLALDLTAIHFSPPRRRSLFTLASGMLMFAAKTYNIPQIVAPVKEVLTSLAKDPFLELSEESTLTSAGSTEYAHEYASEADEIAALSSLARISLVGNLSNEALAARIIEASSSLAEDEGARLKKRLTEKFTPEDIEFLGSRLHSNVRSTHPSQDSISFDELTAATIFEDEGSGSELSPMLRDTASSAPAQAPSVSQLLDLAKKSAGLHAHAACGPLISYSDTAIRCEAAGADALMKMSGVLNLDSTGAPLATSLSKMKGDSTGDAKKNPGEGLEVTREFADTQNAGDIRRKIRSPTSKPTWLVSLAVEDLKLPPSSPYDNFLKAAGC